MKYYYALIFAALLIAAFLYFDKESEEVKYQELVWQYKTPDQFDFDVRVKDSVLFIQMYTEDSLTKNLIKGDSLSSRILYWDNGYLIIEDNNKKINDTILYEIGNASGINGLLLKITKYDYWFPNIPPVESDVIIPLKTESQVSLSPTNYWETYPDAIEGFKCGDKITWEQLEYFDSWGEYNLRVNPSISIHPTDGQILWITRREIPIGEVNSIIDLTTKKLGFKPRESRTNDNFPSYFWKKGFMEVSLMQEIDFNNNGVRKQSYIFIVRDDEAYALCKLKRNTTDPDRLVHITKEKVRTILQRSLDKSMVDEAMITIDSAITVDPTCYLAHFLKADIKLNSGNINGAKFDCLKAFNLNSYHQPTLELLLMIYVLENDIASATQLVKQKENIINKTARSAQILGDYYRIIEGNMDAACRYYNLAFDRGYPTALKAIQDFCVK
jgi:hypothetical protein